MAAIRLAEPPGVRVRPAGPADEEFLFQVYAHSREDEMRMTGWPAEQQEQFLRMQYNLRCDAYTQNHPDASDLVVEQEGERIGRVILAGDNGALHLVDIALLPAARNRGLGTALIRNIQELARARNCPVILYALVGERAAPLYERLGFRPVESLGVYLRMEWRAPEGA